MQVRGGRRFGEVGVVRIKARVCKRGLEVKTAKRYRWEG